MRNTCRASKWCLSEKEYLIVTYITLDIFFGGGGAWWGMAGVEKSSPDHRLSIYGNSQETDFRHTLFKEFVI